MARRNVDDQVANSPFRDGLQVGADGVDVDAWHKVSARFQDGASLNHEFLKAAACLLRFQQGQL